jgi:hypothetical protein
LTRVRVRVVWSSYDLTTYHGGVAGSMQPPGEKRLAFGPGEGV